jgi:hypothetical protein
VYVVVHTVGTDRYVPEAFQFQIRTNEMVHGRI